MNCSFSTRGGKEKNIPERKRKGGGLDKRGTRNGEYKKKKRAYQMNEGSQSCVRGLSGKLKTINCFRSKKKEKRGR